MSKHHPSLRSAAATAAFAAALAGSISPAQACPEPLFITAPTTLTTPVGCVFVIDATIEGDIVNNTTIHDGDEVGDNVVSIIDSTITGRFINNGEISNGSLLFFNFWTRGSDVQGGIVNNGSMLSADSGALSLGGYIGAVPFSTVQTGAIDNFGSMSGAWGFTMFAGSSFLNTLTNHEGATISGTDFGILEMSDGNNWVGGIRNSGTISGGIVGILLQSPFAGGIVNTATGVISGGTFDGIRMTGAQFSGGIDNSGRITSTSGLGIFVPFVPSGVFSGDIVNRAGGLIEGSTGGVDVISPGWTGNFFNAGTIRATTGDAVHINNSTGSWGGSIVNDGLLQGGPGPTLETAGLHLDFGEWNGGILNRGTITSERAGVLAAADIWNGDVDNRGTIGGAAAGSGLLIGSLTFTGTISNSATGIIEGQYAGFGICDSECSTDSVQTGVNFIGTFFNAGRISNAGTPYFGIPIAAVNIFANTWTGDIVNETGGLISSPNGAISISKQDEFFGEGVPRLPVVLFEGDLINRGTMEGAVDLLIAQWTGNFDNSGSLTANSAGSPAFLYGAGNWTGGLNNSGTIVGGIASVGIELDGAISGGILNTGTIAGGTTAILLQGPFAGGIVNSATGEISGGTSHAIFATGSQLLGGIDNAGQITSASDRGILVDFGLFFAGDIVNRAGGLIEGLPRAIEVRAPTWAGNLLNAGTIRSTTFSAVQVNNPVGGWSGSITNDGLIQGGSVALTVVLTGEWSGGITNNGTIRGDGGVLLVALPSWTGDLINTGTISGTTGAFAIIGGALGGPILSWDGILDNSGTLAAETGTAIFIDGDGGNGIFNSGTIRGAIDLSAVTTALTYRQTGAASETGFPFGSILLSDTAVTTLDFQGGRLFGLVTGGADLNDVFEVNAGLGGSFEYVTGIASNLASFAVNSGKAIIGDTEITAASITVGPGATLFLSQGSAVPVPDAILHTTNLILSPTSSLEMQLTTNTAVHPFITVSGTANLAGAFVAHIDPISFAGSGQTQFAYNGLISGPVTGTFSSVTIAGSPNLFRITPIYNSFDLLIERLAFTEFADPDSPNQESVGGALEEIFEEGTDDDDLLNLIDTIAGSGDAGAIYDAIAGSTQAESDLAALKTDDPWKQSVAQRVDAARSTGCTIAGDTWCFTRTAQAPSPVQTDALEDPGAFDWIEAGLRDAGATSLWGRVVGVWGETDGGVSSPASRQRTYGLIAGADHVVDSTLLVGVAGQYVRTKADFDGSLNESSIEALQAGAYFSYGGAETYLNGNASVIATHASTKRVFSVGAIDYLAAVRYPSTSVTGSLELGAIYEVGDGYRIEPHAGLNYAAQFTDAYAEHGAGGLGLLVDPDDLHSLRSMVGGRVSRVFELADRKIVPELRLEWRHEYLDRSHTFLAAFQGAPDVTFVVDCEPAARDALAVGAAITLPIAGRITGYLDAEGAFSEDARSGAVSLGARATW